MKVISDGVEFDFGIVETKPTIGIIDYTRRVTDDFGVTTVVERGFARRMSVRLALPFDSVDEVQRRLAELRATPARWVADARFGWLDFEGFYKSFELDLAVPPLSYCTLTVEGLAEMELGADGGGDPAPAGPLSNFLLVQPVAIAGPVFVSSTVPENDHPAWDIGTTYAVGARVADVTAHRIYESVADGNIGNDPTGDSGQWLDVGPTNRWAMFDQALGTSTVNGGGVEVQLAPGAVDGLALLDVVGTSVRVQAPSGYDKTLPVGNGAVTFLDLPGAVGTLTITISGAGAVSVGTLLVGRIVRLGITGDSPTAGIADFSRKETDDFGEVTVVPRAWAKRMSARTLIRTDALDTVANRIAAVRGTPALWIANEGTDSLTVYGFFKDFSIEVGETVSTVSLSIEGLSQAAPILPSPTYGAPGDSPVGPSTGNEVAKNIETSAGIIIRQTQSSYERAQFVAAQMTWNGKSIRAIARTITEARVDPVTGEAFAKAGLEVDVNGLLSGIYTMTDGREAQVKIAADKLLLIRPGTTGSDPNDVLLRVEGLKTTLHDVFVNKIEADTIETQHLTVRSITTPTVEANAITGKTFWYGNFGSGIPGDELGASSGGSFAHFGEALNKARVVPQGAVLDTGAEVSIRMLVNMKRTGGDDDRVTFRLIRNGPSGSEQVGDIVLTGMSGYPDVISYEWTDYPPEDGAYSYDLEYRRDAGVGTYYHAKMICDLGKR